MSQDAFHKDTLATDAIGRLVAAWRQERPDLDPSAKEITGRIIRLASVFQGATANASSRWVSTKGITGCCLRFVAPVRPTSSHPPSSPGTA